MCRIINREGRKIEIILIGAFVSGAITAFVAQLKNYSGPLCFVYGFFFPTIALIVMALFKETRTAKTHHQVQKRTLNVQTVRS